MSEATLSTKHQIVIPREAREALQVKPGDKLLVIVKGNRLIAIEKPANHEAAIRGLGKGVFPRGYLRKERRSWQ